MSDKIRRHTIIVTRDSDDCITGLQLEKDWYSSDFASAYEYKVVESRPQGDFYFVGFGLPITTGMKKLFTDNIIRGKIKVISLQEHAWQTQYVKPNGQRRA